MPIKGAVYALLAAALFGVTTPFAKEFLHAVEPIMVAGLFYLGSGGGLAFYILTRRLQKVRSKAAPLTKIELPWLAGAILAGGIIAPVLLMLGLKQSQASAASLFLNFEGVFTALIAWLVFKENCDRRIVLGMLAIIAGGVVLSFNATGLAYSTGLLYIAFACLSWAVDNNLTRKVSNADAAQIACYKGLTAGFTNMALAFALHMPMPAWPLIAATMTVGFLGYGCSLVLFVVALRHIGAARTGAYFALAPFLGAAVAIIFFKEAFTLQIALAAAFMGLGLWLHLTEHHEHEHIHEEIEHEHEPIFDEHHKYSEPVGPPGSNRHRHKRLVHSHPHFPDQHHTHSH